MSRDGFSVFVFSVSEEHLTQVAEELEVPLAQRLGHSAVLRGASGWTKPLFGVFEGALRQAADDSLDAGALDASHRLDVEATRGLVECLHPDGESLLRTQSRQRKQLFDHARTYVVSKKDDPGSVESLCEALKTNQRTLHRAFREHCGVSTKAYLRAYRLNGARKELRRCAPQSTTVGANANRWGFWHMGQFAADYRRHFDELPSETLARTNSRPFDARRSESLPPA